jgi:hypothetical protein
VVRNGPRCRRSIPPYQNCHRRFQQWAGEGKFAEALRLLAKHLHQRGKLYLDEAFVDATFTGARCAAITAAGKSNGFSHRCKTIADWSHDGNTTSKKFSALCNLLAA